MRAEGCPWDRAGLMRQPARPDLTPQTPSSTLYSQSRTLQTLPGPAARPRTALSLASSSLGGRTPGAKSRRGGQGRPEGRGRRPARRPRPRHVLPGQGRLPAALHSLRPPGPPQGLHRVQSDRAVHLEKGSRGCQRGGGLEAVQRLSQAARGPGLHAPQPLPPHGGVSRLPTRPGVRPVRAIGDRGAAEGGRGLAPVHRAHPGAQQQPPAQGVLPADPAPSSPAQEALDLLFNCGSTEEVSGSPARGPLSDAELALFDPFSKEEGAGPSPTHTGLLAAMEAEAQGPADEPWEPGGPEEEEEDGDGAPPPAYLSQATELITQALRDEKAGAYAKALQAYRDGVHILLRGVPDDPCPARREGVKKKAAEYLKRAEEILHQHLSQLPP
ncbi:sorting nexin-15 isoform X1 [Sorex araneus]|uniref:sorting nexin-15 isoform X1 n=1 Tax=Sorex araneus TaxID=42254 RepID=UPI00243338A9|nr:sorting nexin-15 isoform X1 [Sorex araneus]